MNLNRLRRIDCLYFSRRSAVNWLFGSIILISSSLVFASVNSCPSVFNRTASVPRTGETLKEWRKHLDPDTVYSFKDNDPTSEEVAYYNWGDGHYSRETLAQGITGKNLQILTKQSHTLDMGLYVANNMFGRSHHGDTMMEVVIYKDKRPLIDGGSTSWTPVTGLEFRRDVKGAYDGTPRLSYGLAHEDFVVLDPRVIKALRWPSKRLILGEIKRQGEVIQNEIASKKVFVGFEEKIVAYLKVITQIFISDSFTPQDRRDFIAEGKVVKEFTAKRRGILENLILKLPVRNMRTVSRIQIYDNFFRATINENTEFIHYDYKNTYFSFSHLIEASRNMTDEQLALLKQSLPDDGAPKNSLAEMVSLTIAVKEKDKPRALEIMMSLNAQLAKIRTYSHLRGWKQGWGDLYNAQLRDIAQADALVNQL